MVALLSRASAATLLALAWICAGAQENVASSPHRWLLQADIRYSAVDSNLASWLSGGGKLRYDETDPHATLDRLLLQYSGTISPTLFAHAVVDYQDDGPSGFDLTEAYFEWRPVPRSPTRHRLKLGAFYPRLSLENIAPGWETPFSISSSAVNSWIAEEIRTLGAEWSMQRPLQPGSAHEIGAFASVYYGNDPIGTLLAWKGWGIHDRQTRWRDRVSLPPLPQLGAGQMLARQAPWAEPFHEIDHRPGFLAGTEWRYARRALLQLSHYDNHADPLDLAEGQYAWATRFDQMAVQFSFPWEIGFMAQWMRGYTAMGPVVDSARVVDVEFEASYVLLTRAHDRHRMTIRYDDFEVIDRDSTPLDDNDDSGHAVAIAYIYDVSSQLGIALEWLRIDSNHPSRSYAGEGSTATEKTLQAQLRWRFDTRLN